MVFTDFGRMQQVVLNLLSNALKFTGENGNIIIRCWPLIEAGEKFVKVSIQDNGIGIKKEEQSKLFQLFGFLESSKSNNPDGIGLGLAIC